MMKRTITAAATVALAVALVPAPAEAKWNGGSIRHHTDAGYDDPILVSCDDGTGDQDTYTISEGQHSDDRCPTEDVQKVYVRYNEEIWCYVSFRGAGWQLTYDKNGWHGVGNFQNKQCVVQRD